MTDQQSILKLSRDELFYLRSALHFLADPKRCTQPLQDITEKVNAAFQRLDRKKREVAVADNQMPLIDYIETGAP
jgi:hypothetical protein